MTRAILFCLLASFLAPPAYAVEPVKPADIFRQDNLVAWCIVPFDSKKRGPAERVEMLQKLGFKKYAYDWRAEHLPTFDEEVALLKKAKIELTAVWFPANLGDDAKKLLAVIKKQARGKTAVVDHDGRTDREGSSSEGGSRR
jgi:hypothetical protein